MKLRYTVTKKAYFDFNIYHIQNLAVTRRQVRKTRIMPPVIWSLTGLVFCGYFLQAQQSVPLALPVALFVVSVLWIILYPICFRKALEKKLTGWVDKGIGKEFIGDFTLELLEDRIRTEGESGVAETMYDNIERLVVNKGCLYIYIGSLSAHILPLEAFDNEEAYREFRSFLEKKIPAPKAQGVTPAPRQPEA